MCAQKGPCRGRKRTVRSLEMEITGCCHPNIGARTQTLFHWKVGDLHHWAPTLKHKNKTQEWFYFSGLLRRGFSLRLWLYRNSQAAMHSRGLPASTSWVLGLKECSSTTQSKCAFFKSPQWYTDLSRCIKLTFRKAL